MRGFTKAAALLSFTEALTLVIPNSLTSPPSSLESGIEYHPEQALLNFNLSTADDESKEHYPTFTIQVEGTKSACGESHILLNGLRLHTEWNGFTAHGRDYFDFNGAREAEWHVTCLFERLHSNGVTSIGDDVVHVLSLRFASLNGAPLHGFTTSYKQTSKPAIIRFLPSFISSDFSKYSASVNRWRVPSIEFDPDILANAGVEGSRTSISSIERTQKSLGGFLKTVKGSLKKGVGKALGNLCGKYAKGSKHGKASSDKHFQSDDPYASDLEVHEEISPTTQSDSSTATTSVLSAAETRSLENHPAPSSPSPTLSDALTFPSNHQIHWLKIFGLVLVLSSLVAWICLRCRDPRRRADCLARREERRNKKLYRRAVRQHRVKMWFWNFRIKYGLAPREVITWDEKRSRVIQQENTLEEAMTEDIRALRNAHRVETSLTTAEEGNAFTYGSESSERRRSVSTLPGYSSDASEPPTYDEADDSYERAALVDGFRFNRCETEFRSDSSVISTSPRISRDGTNSDFDEKFEPISLESGPAGRCT